MFTSRLLGAAIAVAIASSTGFVLTAASQEKLTYEQAWKRCTAFARDSGGIGWENTKYLRGAACMKKYGHNI